MLVYQRVTRLKPPTTRRQHSRTLRSCLKIALSVSPDTLSSWHSRWASGDTTGLPASHRENAVKLGMDNNGKTRWWQLKYFLFPTPNLGEMIQFDKHIFSDGLKPPTSKIYKVGSGKPVISKGPCHSTYFQAYFTPVAHFVLANL